MLPNSTGPAGRTTGTGTSVGRGRQRDATNQTSSTTFQRASNASLLPATPVPSSRQSSASVPATGRSTRSQRVLNPTEHVLVQAMDNPDRASKSLSRSRQSGAVSDNSRRSGRETERTAPPVSNNALKPVREESFDDHDLFEIEAAWKDREDAMRDQMLDEQHNDSVIESIETGEMPRKGSKMPSALLSNDSSKGQDESNPAYSFHSPPFPRRRSTQVSSGCSSSDADNDDTLPRRLVPSTAINPTFLPGRSSRTSSLSDRPQRVRSASETRQRFVVPLNSVTKVQNIRSLATGADNESDGVRMTSYPSQVFWQIFWEQVREDMLFFSKTSTMVSCLIAGTILTTELCSAGPSCEEHGRAKVLLRHIASAPVGASCDWFSLLLVVTGIWHIIDAIGQTLRRIGYRQHQRGDLFVGWNDFYQQALPYVTTFLAPICVDAINTALEPTCLLILTLFLRRGADFRWLGLVSEEASPTIVNILVCFNLHLMKWLLQAIEIHQNLIGRVPGMTWTRKPVVFLALVIGVAVALWDNWARFEFSPTADKSAAEAYWRTGVPRLATAYSYLRTG